MTSPLSAPLTVIKVGGSLLADGDGLDRVARAVAARRRGGERLLVVVSAFKGVTDELERGSGVWLDPRSGDEIVRDVVTRLERRHAAVVAGEPMRDAMLTGVRRTLDGVLRLLTGVRLTGELTDRTHDLLLAHGERMAAPVLAQALRSRGVDARSVTSEEARVVATGSFRVGTCDLERTRAGLRSLAHELNDRVLVLTGFYGVNADGEVTLFGRGGTDYSAGIAAACLDAEAVELWKDVPGFMSADPTLVEGARLVPELSFAEACELGYYGARILHPRCLEPLRGRSVRIELRSIFDVERAGTRIVERDARGASVAALVHRPGVAVVRVGGAAMVNQPGVAGRILTAVGEAGVNVDTLAASMTSVSFTIDDRDTALVRRTLRLLQEQSIAGVERVDVSRGMALLGVVGDGVASDPSLLARVLACLAGQGRPVELVSHGPGDVGLSCVVPEDVRRPALVALHDAFFPATERVSDAPR
ncbi:MAG: aspartate kinase [Planctomycetes bacterium]|nr:aspartate kinase [Planctomycetota bacterium]